jgi:hypothetical protein
MSTQYRVVQSGKTASGGCSAGQVSSEPVAPRIIIMSYYTSKSSFVKHYAGRTSSCTTGRGAFIADTVPIVNTEFSDRVFA